MYAYVLFATALSAVRVDLVRPPPSVDNRCVMSALRRHTGALRRRQFCRFASSLTSCTLKSKICKVLRGMGGFPTPRDVFIALRFKTALELSRLAGDFAVRFIVYPNALLDLHILDR